MRNDRYRRYDADRFACVADFGVDTGDRDFENVEGIARVEFNKKDIVRHKLVQRIVEAYEKHDEKVRKASMSKKYEQAEKKEKSNGR